MKRIATITMITILAICLLAGCSSQEATPNTTSETSVSKQDLTQIASTSEPFDMEESELRELYLKLYAEKQKDENFISDVESKVYKDFNFYIRNSEDGFITLYNQIYDETRNLYYPILLPDTDEVVIVYVNEHGELCVYNATQDKHDYFRNIHVPENTAFTNAYADYTVCCTDNTVQFWEFGKLLAEEKVPEGSIYVGFSDWEGYLFRNSEDVYSIKLTGSEEESILVAEAIAHGVKEVIITDYKLNSDAWSQPLFLMEDGSIKAYCSWNGDQNAPRDDACHLTPPQHEGGYQ